MQVVEADACFDTARPIPDDGPLVSVMMLTYNHAAHVLQAIEGVLAQRVTFPFELVIGEDCSTDGTRAMVLALRDKHPDVIRVITSAHNVGMKQNAYRTTKACRGKYLAFCEGDDYWHHPYKLQKQVDYLEGHPECGLVFSSYAVSHVASARLIPDFFAYRRWEIPDVPDVYDILSFFKGVLNPHVHRGDSPPPRRAGHRSRPLSASE